MPVQQMSDLDSRILRYAVCVGGTSYGVAIHPEIARADVVLHFDVSSELASAIYEDGDARVITIPVAEGWDTQSLAKHFKNKAGWKRITEVVEGTVVSTGTGLNQAPAVGAMAYLVTSTREQYAEAIVRGRTVTNNNPQMIIVEAYGSFSGGTGGGVLMLAVNDLVNALKKAFRGKTITIHYNIIGTTTFDNMPQVFKAACRPNNAVRLMQLLGNIAFTQEREVPIGRFYELPQSGTQKELRDTYMALLTQALSAKRTQTTIDIPQNNMSSHYGPYGRVLFFHTGFTRINNGVKGAASYASALLTEVHKLLEEAPAGSAYTIDIQPKVEEVGSIKHTELLNRVEPKGSTRPKDAFPAYIQSKYNTSCIIAAHVLEGVTLQIEGLIRVDVPSGMASYREQLSKLLALQAALKAKKVDTDLDEADAQSAYDDVYNRIDVALAKLAPMGFGESFGAVFQNRQHTVDNLADALDEFHRLEKDLEEKKAITLAMSDVQKKVDEKIAQLKGYVEKVQLWLREFSKAGVKTEFFTFHPLENLFTQLIKARASENRQRFEQLLSRGVRGLTPLGIATLIGSDVTDLSALAHKLLQPPQERGAEWSGNAPDMRLMSILVLPKMDEDLFVQLSAIIESQADDPNFKVTMTDTLAAGIAVTRFDISGATTFADIMSNYASDYELALGEHTTLMQASTPNMLEPKKIEAKFEEWKKKREVAS